MIYRVYRWFVPAQPTIEVPGFPNCDKCVRLLRGRMVLRLMDHLHRQHNMDPIAAQELGAYAGNKVLEAIRRHRKD